MLNIEMDVLNHVKDYFTFHLPEYEVLEVRRKSIYPEDNYLYMVSAKKNELMLYGLVGMKQHNI